MHRLPAFLQRLRFLVPSHLPVAYSDPLTSGADLFHAGLLSAPVSDAPIEVCTCTIVSASWKRATLMLEHECSR